MPFGHIALGGPSSQRDEDEAFGGSSLWSTGDSPHTSLSLTQRLLFALQWANKGGLSAEQTPLAIHHWVIVKNDRAELPETRTSPAG